MLAATVAFVSCAARARGAAPPAAPAPPLLTRNDAWLGAASLAGVVALGWADRPLRDQARQAGGTAARRLSRLVRPLGTPVVLAPGLLLGAAAGRLLDRPALTRASARIAA